MGEIDTIEAELRAAEQAIYDTQYGAIDPITGEIMNPGEMDRLLSTYRERSKRSKKQRDTDRDSIVALLKAEGVSPALAEADMNMIYGLHGDAVDTAYNYIDSLWRIGKMSHQERNSMITNMMGSYRLQLRDQMVEMLMAEEISAAEDRGVAREEAFSADAIAELFPNMTEDQIYGLMTGGLEDQLQVPALGTITDGPWAGYTEGDRAAQYLRAGYEYNAGNDTWTLPADDEITGLIESGVWAGLTQGEKSAKLVGLGWTLEGEGETAKWVPPVEPKEEAGTVHIPVESADGVHQTWEDLGYASAEAAEEMGLAVNEEGQVFRVGDAEDLADFMGEAPEPDPGETIQIPLSELKQGRTGGYEVKAARGPRPYIEVNAAQLQLLGTTGAFKDPEPDSEDLVYIDESKFTGPTDGYTKEGTSVVLSASHAINMANLGLINIEDAVTDKKYKIRVSDLPTNVSVDNFIVLGGGAPGVPQYVEMPLAEYVELKNAFPEVEEYDPLERFNTGLTVEDAGGLVPFGAEDRDGELWMTPDGYSKFVDEMNYEEPDVPTHGVDAGVTWDIAVDAMASPTYRSDVRRSLYEWNDDLGSDYQYDIKQPDGREALYADAIRRWSEKYVTEAKIVAHVTNRIVYGSTTRDRYETGNIMVDALPAHEAEPDADAQANFDLGLKHWAAVPVANGQIAMIYGSSAQAVKDSVKQDYPDKR